MEKKALVIAGGVPQKELLKELKRRGYYTLLADGNSNPVARPFADKFFHIDVFDIDSIEKISKEEKVDFLITVCADQVLLVVAEVSERLGLPCYIDLETCKDVSDKIRMKKIFKANGIPTTDYVETNSLDLDKISHLKYPLVVKPVDAYSSKGVRKVNNVEELKVFYEEASTISRSGNVIVEEYFKGEEISVDAFVVNGKAKVLCISNSDKVKDKDRFVIFRGRYPAFISDKIKEEIEIVVQKIADAFHLENSPLLVQLLSNGENISVLEFCARTGGNMKYLLIKYSSGIDVIGATIDITEGKPADLKPKSPTYKIVVNDFIYCYPGKFDHLEGFKDLLNDGIINEYHEVRLRGTQMKGVTSSGDRVAGINIVADSIDDYNKKLKIINSRVKVISTEGLDIMRHDLLPSLEIKNNTK